MNLAGLSLSLSTPRGSGAASVAYTGLVANRVRPLLTAHTGNKQAMSRSYHKSSVDITALQIIWAHWAFGGTAGSFEVGHGTDAWLTASIEYPAGTFTQVTFPPAYQATGATVALMPIVSTTAATVAGGNVTSDAMSVTIPANTGFWIRTWYDSTRGGAQAGGGIYYVANIRDSANGDLLKVAASGVADQTMSGTIVHNASTAYLPPIAIIGTTTKAAAIIVGDSIAYSQNGASADPLNSRNGTIATAFPTDLPFLNLSSPGLKAGNCLTASPNRQELYSYGSSMYNNLGINDTTGATAADIAASNTAIAAVFPARTRKYLCTLTPRTSSATDNWTTTSGQTAHGSTPTLYQPYNVLVRAGVSGYTDYIEQTHGVLEAAPDDSGLYVLSADNRILTDAVTTATSTTVTSATGAFTSADVGVGINIAGAGAAGATLKTTISSITNSTTVVLALAAGTSVNPATMKIGAMTNDGLHPLTPGNVVAAAAIPAGSYADPT